MLLKVDIKKVVTDIGWWAGVIGLLLLSQIGIGPLLYLFRETWVSGLIDPILLEKDPVIIADVVTPVRGIILLFSLFVLAYPIFQNIRQSELVRNSQINYKHFLEAILLFIVLCIIFTPGDIGGLTEEYSNTTAVMFSKTTTVSYHRRFLMPALAHILFFRGDLFFLLFSFICAMVMIFILRLWFETNHIPVSFWQLVSLGTASFVYFQIIGPGYPDVLVNILILLAFVFASDTRAKLSLFTLSLATHEASLIIWFALALILFDAKGFVQFLVISGIYLILLLALNDGLAGVLAERQVGETSNLVWVLENSGREILGIFFSMKALWIMVIGAISYLLLRRELRAAFQVVAILLAGVSMTFMGVDTSRLFGWTFMAILISWRILEHSEGRWKKIINTALVINILIPSVEVYLFAVYPAPGLYDFVLNLL